MSDTPRTDAREWDWHEDCSPVDDMIVDADFARQLERELAEARRQRDALINILTDVINDDGTAKSIDRASLFLTAVKGGSHE